MDQSQGDHGNYVYDDWFPLNQRHIVLTEEQKEEIHNFMKMKSPLKQLTINSVGRGKPKVIT